MKFEYFIKANKSLAIVISIEEYESVKSLLEKFYTEKQIKHIDDFCKYKATNTKFLLCNPHKTEEICTPMMYHNAVTFIDRVPFANIQF